MDVMAGKSLTFEIGNYRTKLRQAGCTDVVVNGGKRKGQASPRSVKKPKWFEINFLPNFPEGGDEHMDSTFALRRKELVDFEPPVKDTVERWPALFTEGQVNPHCLLNTLINFQPP